MNFVDPKEYNYPGLVRKNRYKTILPSEYSRNRNSPRKKERDNPVVRSVKAAVFVLPLFNNSTYSSTI